MRVLEFQNVSKKNKDHTLDDFTFYVERSEIHGLVCQEPETQQIIVELICGIMKTDEGDLTYHNRPIHSGDYKHLSRIGIVTKSVFFYENLTGFENLKLFLKNYKRFRSSRDYKEMLNSVDEYFELFNMTSFKHTLVRKYSLGAKQKLRIIRSLMIEPDCLILDEPFINLDSVSIQVIMEYLNNKCKNRGLSVLVLSSTFNPISSLSHRVSLIHKGRLLDTISKDELLKKQKSHIIVESKELSKLLLFLEKDLSIFNYEVINNEQVYLYDGLLESDKILKLGFERGIPITKVQFGYDSMENYFMNQMGENI